MARHWNNNHAQDFGETITIGNKPEPLEAFLRVPYKPEGIVVFAHGSGSSRFSPRNNFIAKELNKSHIATLLLDLLTEEESLDRANVFDVYLLASRLMLAHDWIGKQKELRTLSVGYFGASTGSAAALEAAAFKKSAVKAVVSRGGRPDLAMKTLSQVTAPTCLIVGEKDPEVLELNRQAFEQLKCVKEIIVVPEATHLFEEPGTLEQVAELATEWFERFFPSVHVSAETTRATLEPSP